jgi:hypothetical protein
MCLWTSYKKKNKNKIFFTSLNSLKKRVGSRVGSGSISQRYGSGSATKCYGYPTQAYPVAIVVEEDPLVPCGPPEAGGEPPHLVQGRVQALPVPATPNQVISVADQGCLSRIRIFSIPDPGPRIRIEELKYFIPKNGF